RPGPAPRAGARSRCADPHVHDDRRRVDGRPRDPSGPAPLPRIDDRIHLSRRAGHGYALSMLGDPGGSGSEALRRGAPAASSRASIIDAVRAGGSSVVAVTAAAGYGKSVLLAQWARSEDRAVASV